MIKTKSKVKILVSHLISIDARFECIPIFNQSGNVPQKGYEVNILSHDNISKLVNYLHSDELNTIEVAYDRDIGWVFHERT